MPKPRAYSPEDKAVALAALQAMKGDFKRAARFAKVEEKRLRFWAGGGDEDELDLQTPDLSGRPRPPEPLCDPNRDPILFAPAHNVAEWVRENILEETGPLYNADHWHLTGVSVGFLWTNIEYHKKGKRVAGTAEKAGGGGGWQGGRALYQLLGWFGEAPTFLITLDSVYAAYCSDAAFCALVEHELYHCAVRTDENGTPLFTPDGETLTTIRGHDCEEFVGVVARYGVGAAAAGVAALVAAGTRKPLFAEADIELACGTCH